MRLLVLSDIHSNYEALEACLDAAPQHDGVANLGDVVGYGASPNQVIDLLRSLDPISVRGNHDRCCSGLTDASDFNSVAAEAMFWTRSELSDSSLDWLRELPRGPLRDANWEGVQFVHGSPLDEDAYITSEFTAGAALAASPFRLTFFGHTHLQGAYARLGLATEELVPERLNSASRLQISRLKLNPKMKCLINPGSVGQPRDYDRRAAFALYDSRKHEILFYRVPYDIALAQERILQAGLPRMLAVRLEDGR